jgi:hypothetical protein
LLPHGHRRPCGRGGSALDFGASQSAPFLVMRAPASLRYVGSHV